MDGRAGLLRAIKNLKLPPRVLFIFQGFSFPIIIFDSCAFHQLFGIFLGKIVSLGELFDLKKQDLIWSKMSVTKTLFRLSLQHS